MGAKIELSLLDQSRSNLIKPTDTFAILPKAVIDTICALNPQPVKSSTPPVAFDLFLIAQGDLTVTVTLVFMHLSDIALTFLPSEHPKAFRFVSEPCSDKSVTFGKAQNAKALFCTSLEVSNIILPVRINQLTLPMHHS